MIPTNFTAMIHDSASTPEAKCNRTNVLSSKKLGTYPVSSGDECKDVREFISNLTGQK